MWKTRNKYKLLAVNATLCQFANWYSVFKPSQLLHPCCSDIHPFQDFHPFILVPNYPSIHQIPFIRFHPYRNTQKECAQEKELLTPARSQVKVVREVLGITRKERYLVGREKASDHRVTTLLLILTWSHTFLVQLIPNNMSFWSFFSWLGLRNF